MIAGIGDYIGKIDRETGEPATDLLRRKYGLTQEGRKNAYIWLCALICEKLTPELGPTPALTPMGRAIQKERTARRVATKEAEAEEDKANAMKKGWD
jgi:hypothetical protein